tara:strand:+ start:2507 stop:2965 length:459 start_codon:yes stop_codon:yes gene_type:complete
MRLIIPILIVCFFTIPSLSGILKPNPKIKPEEVILIQLSALQNNNIPYDNAGIEQTWEFAHPSNKEFTGPLSNFTNMMYSKQYSIILNHKNHKIINVKNDDEISFFFVEITDFSGNRFGFQWTVKKVVEDGILKNCWMTIGVSQPMPIAKSA